MTQTNRHKGLIRMAMMGTAFVGLTIVLIVFQPGSPRHQASLPAANEPSVTRVAPALDQMSAPTSVATAQDSVVPAPAPNVARQTSASSGQDPKNVRDMTFAAISNLKSVTTGEAPAPGEPGSLLHSVVQRSIGTVPQTTVAPVDPVQNASTRPIKRPNSGSYFVQPGDSLVSIAQEIYGDVSMAAALFEQNKGVMSRPDNLRVGMVLVLPSP